MKCERCALDITERLEGSVCFDKVLRRLKCSKAELAKALGISSTQIAHYLAGTQQPNPTNRSGPGI